MIKKLEQHPLKLLIVGVGLISTLMILFSCLILSDSETSFIGLEIAFGHEFASLGSWASGEITFNPLVLLAYLMPLAASLVLLFSKKGYLIATLLFITATILMFMIPELTTVTVTLLGNVNEIDVEWNYGTGVMIALALSIFGMVASAFMSYKNQ
jgi:hypothetical protein